MFSSLHPKKKKKKKKEKEEEKQKKNKKQNTKEKKTRKVQIENYMVHMQRSVASPSPVICSQHALSVYQEGGERKGVATHLLTKHIISLPPTFPNRLLKRTTICQPL